MRRFLLVCFSSLLLTSCAAEPPKEQPASSIPAPPSDAAFNQWLKGVKKEASSKGISKATIDDALTGIAHDDRVIRLDRRQPETKLTLEEYLAKVISDQRINRGRELLAEHRALLEPISQKYGVASEFIVALWGIETSYGNNTGSFSVIESLATLAYDGRRSQYFRGELMNALRIIEEDHISAYAMEGSWAGAMGQCQFMPSSFLAYAVDYNGDGKRDIWNTEADVFASIANYLNQHGWNQDKENQFNVILKWNRSRYFATAVMQIAERIKEGA
ncbi:MAG: lytic murein transglycosylase [Rickettsiales bacterium]|nr:lytic murein transglycosylase [Rickettsiales bacterium]